LIGVSVVSDNSLEADILSTSLFVAGLEKGAELLQSYPQTEAILVDTQLRVHVTQGLRDRFQAAENVKCRL
jgi:thiamine biosynthesis lipoprotein